TLTATDVDGGDVTPDSVTWQVVTGPAHGSLSSSSGAMTHGMGAAYSVGVTYTPAPNYNGPDSFTFKVNDGDVDSNEATVTITINAVNDAPVANDDSATTDEDSAVAKDVVNNDSDVDSANADLKVNAGSLVATNGSAYLDSDKR